MPSTKKWEFRMLLCLVIDTLPCPGTNFPRQKDSLQPARQKWSEKDSGTYNWRKVHPSKLAWLNLNFSIISDSIKTPLKAIETTPYTMTDLVAEGGGSRQKGIHILKVSARGTGQSQLFSRNPEEGTFQPIVYGNVSKYFGKKREEDGHTHQVFLVQ